MSSILRISIPLRFTMWTAGLSLFTDVSKKNAFRKLVRHPCIIAVFVGLILMVAPISLPNFLEEAIDITSGCTVPLSMIVIGTILADAPNPISILQIRAMVHLFTVGVLSRADLAGAKAVPAGFNAGQCLHSDNGDARRQHDFHFGDKYGGDAIFASQIIFASTLCSILTTPC